MGFGFRRPKNRVPGLDVAGTAVAVGAEVTRFRSGDEVFGIARGSFAEYAVAREDKLAPKPPGLSFGQAAVVPVSGLTLDLVRSMGADHVLDHTREGFADGSRRYDLILDIGGNSRLSRLRRALTPTGTLVIVGGQSGGKRTGGFDRQLRAAVLSLFVRQRLTKKVAITI